MALSETTAFEPSAADLINLKNILAICNGRCTIPDVGPFTLRPDLSLEHHYTFALDRFEKTSRVFDDAYYEEEVLSIVMSEDKLDEVVVNEAKEKGVPESHFPRKRKRNRMRPPMTAVLSPGREGFAFPNSLRKPYTSASSTQLQSPRNTFSTTPSSSVLSDQEPQPALPYSGFHIPKTSVISFMSNSSTSSWLPSGQRKQRRRDSLMQLFRREPKKGRKSPSAMSNHPMCTTPSIAEVPELSSAQSHGSQDLSSSQSLDLSTRTSTSSFAYHPVSPATLDLEQLQQFKQTPQFQDLRRRCEDEYQCFNDYAQHQRVALPLILGRNRLWLEDRKRMKLEGLKKSHKKALEELEEQHVEKELAEIERLRLEMEDKEQRNATALKYLNNRMQLLGDNVTPEHLNRFEEEINALDTLAIKHERDLEKLIRNQERKKLDLQRHQEVELERYTHSLEEDLEVQSEEKQTELLTNETKLAELVEERRDRLVRRWYTKLQILKSTDKETAEIKDPLPISILGFPAAFTDPAGVV